jgi:uncharacterized membrane protein YhhN
MTTSATILLVFALAIAVIDWWAVATDRLNIEFLAKPSVMVILIAVALAVETDNNVGRGLVIAALGASLVGDVVLMLPDGRFELGLAAFLVAHLIYLVAFIPELHFLPAVIALAVIGAVSFAIVPRLMAEVRPHGSLLMIAVPIYIAAVSATAVFAAGTAVWTAAIGGMLFLISDALLGWDKFVGPAPGGRVAVHVTYHLGQMGLVTWLAA